MHKLLLAVAFFVALLSTPTQAEPSYPVAIRWWGQGMVSIESWWNLSVVIDPYNNKIGYEVPDLAADLVLVAHEHSDHNNVSAMKGEPRIVRGLDKQARARKLVGQLRPDATWHLQREGDSIETFPHPSAHHANSIAVQSIPAWHDDSQGSERGAVAMFVVETNGVRLAHLSDLGQTELTDEQLKALGKVDVLCLPVGVVYTIDGEQTVAIIEQVKPRYVIPIHYKTDALKIPLEPIEPFLKAVGDRYEVINPKHNTLAVAAAKDGEKEKTQIIVLDYKPWQPNQELATLLKKMDDSCRASQRVFAPLTANQMNWRPPNGTHTPRWNPEHMMGRQLGFFSQIYAAIDPQVFSHIDLNPEQMPEDYTPAHPDWDGAEEARQMQRANAYVQRFAYLLDGLDLDQQAPGSRWTLRGLLKQMDRHFTEHTENVKKKFELEGWPKE